MMNRIIIDGKALDLSHLRPFVVAVHGKGRDGGDLRVRAHLGLHTISTKCGAGERPDFDDENGKPRVFNADRFRHSQSLPILVRRMIAQNFFCWESSDRNRGMNYAIVDAPPGEVRNLQDGENQMIFFYLYPGATDGVDVELFVTSCYKRYMYFSRVKRRFTIQMLLRKCLFQAKRIP